MSFKILNINRHRMFIDGKGINTLVALSSCPLDCKYCLNKEIIKKNNYKESSIEELLDYVIIDYCYFIATGGGITFGGGEPLLQSKEIHKFRKILPKEIPINIETSLNIPIENLKEIIKDIDLFIIDIKTLNKESNKRYTGKNIDNLLLNLKYLKEQNLQDKCIIRIPTIENFTSFEDIKETINLINDLDFKNLDVFKYIVKSEK